MSTNKEKRVSRWYFGGVASSGAACCTHPLDLLKVQMQTQKGKNISLFPLAARILKNQGIPGLYKGLSASLLRQMTYSTTRFGIYEMSKQHFLPKDGKPITAGMSMMLAGVSGVAGGLVGNPADLINVRMQNDAKCPPAERRNYKNVIHGIYTVASREGFIQLWAGSTMNCARAALMTIGQLSFYDLTKRAFLSTPYFQDNVFTHVSSSLCAGVIATTITLPVDVIKTRIMNAKANEQNALKQLAITAKEGPSAFYKGYFGAIATTMTQPVDVLKTRIMNAKPGEGKSLMKLVASTAKEGPLAFFKGYVAAFVRLAPHTVLTFVFLEQLRINVGIVQCS